MKTYSVKAPIPLAIQICGLVVLFHATGCSSIKIPEYTSTPAALGQTLVQTVQGLQLQVDPFYDNDRVRTYFGTDLRSLGVLAVFVSARNVSEDCSYLLMREGFTLHFDGATVETTATDAPEHRSGVGEAVSIAGLALLSLPVLLVGSKLMIDAEAVQHNLSKQELQNQMLEPGDAASGFIYFFTRSAPPSAAPPSVKADVIEIPSKQTLTVRF